MLSKKAPSILDEMLTYCITAATSFEAHVQAFLGNQVDAQTLNALTLTVKNPKSPSMFSANLPFTA